MQCPGYKRTAHEVNRLHGKMYCDRCYLKKWRKEHQEEIQCYQKEYRGDPAFKKVNRLYMRDYRKRE